MGKVPTEVTIDGRTARRVPTPFYDAEGARARAVAKDLAGLTAGDQTHASSNLPGLAGAVQRMPGTRIVSTPAALDATVWPSNAIVLRIAPDEMLVIHQESDFSLADPNAIVVPDVGFAGVWLPVDQALRFLESTCEWELPTQRPIFAQGAVAGLAMKLWFEQDRVLLIVPAPFAHELEVRLNG